jgi:hypothetical protein
MKKACRGADAVRSSPLISAPFFADRAAATVLAGRRACPPSSPVETACGPRVPKLLRVHQGPRRSCTLGGAWQRARSRPAARHRSTRFRERDRAALPFNQRLNALRRKMFRTHCAHRPPTRKRACARLKRWVLPRGADMGRVHPDGPPAIRGEERIALELLQLAVGERGPCPRALAARRRIGRWRSRAGTRAPGEQPRRA